jgi:hypothetical protein
MADSLMAITSGPQHLDIAVLKREADRLPSVEADWSTREPEDRVALRAEWDDLMDVFGHVVDAYDRGRLPPTHVDELRAAATALLDALPAMEHMRLRLPPREALGRIVATHVA